MPPLRRASTELGRPSSRRPRPKAEPSPRQGRSLQKKHGGGKFRSEDQRRFLWAIYPKAAKKWANNKPTRATDWIPMEGWNAAGKKRPPGYR